jgi:starvation-inducible outer membrane lipoprotein
MRPAATLALAILAAGMISGCASTPMQVREARPSTQAASKNPPYVAINCAARNVEQGRSGMVASIRETGMRDRYEVAVRELDDTVAVVEAAPAPGGSTLTVWLHPRILPPAAADFMAKLKGC